MRDVGSTYQRGLHVLFLEIRRPRITLGLAHGVLHGGRLVAVLLDGVVTDVVVIFSAPAAGAHVFAVTTIARLGTRDGHGACAVHASKTFPALVLCVEVDEVVLLCFVVLEAGGVVLLLSAAGGIVAHVLCCLSTADRL